MLRHISANGIMVLWVLSHALTCSADSALFDDKVEERQQKAEAGDPKAQYRLGIAYLTGNQVKVDTSKAVLWLDKAHKQGYTKASHRLGEIYASDKDGFRNYKKAYSYFLAAAKKDHPESQLEVALLYRDGKGTSVDLNEAAKWAEKAEKAGVADAKALSVQLAKSMKTLVSKAPDTAAPKPTAASKWALPKSMRDAQRFMMTSEWKTKGKLAEHFPSSRQQCTVEPTQLVCISSILAHNADDYTATVQNETTVTDFQIDGRFNIKYRRKFLTVVTKPQSVGTEAWVPLIGWEKTYRNMRCKIADQDKVRCATDDQRFEDYTK